MDSRVAASAALTLALSISVSQTWAGPRGHKDRARTPVATADEMHQRARDAAISDLRATQRNRLDDAYRKGVTDTLEEFEGRMRARQGFTYEPPIIEYVDMPAQVMNGALYPRHKAPVIISPGRWIESNGVPVPIEVNPRVSDTRVEYVDE